MSNNALMLYRACLKRSKLLAEAPLRQEALWKTKKMFRNNRNETDEKKIETMCREAEQRLEYMLTLIPTHSMSIKDRSPVPMKENVPSSQNFIFDTQGNLTPGMAPIVRSAQYINWGDGNFDPDLVKRFQRQTDRTHFKGPEWEAYRAGYNPYSELRKSPTILDWMQDPSKYTVDADFENAIKYNDPNEANNYRYMQREDFPGLSNEGHDYTPDYEITKKWREKYPGDHKPRNMTDAEWKEKWRVADTLPDPELEVDYSEVPEDPKPALYSIGNAGLKK